MRTATLSLAIAVVYLYCFKWSHQEAPHNVTLWAKSRQKRFLIFDGVGVSKLLVNYAMPVDMYDKKPWRGLASAWNLQWQHNLPTTVQYWWNSSTFPAKGRQANGAPPFALKPTDPTDLSAMFLYAIFEQYMNNKGRNGRACLHRAICQNAQVQYVGGTFDEIYQRLLTPEALMEDHYKDAFVMGKKGVDCYKTFARCPHGESLFDKFVRIDDV